MRLLFINNHYPPDANPTGNLVAQVAEGLVERGHAVTVVTAVPHYARFETEPEWRGRFSYRTNEKGVDIIRVYVHARGGKEKRTRRILNYLTFNLFALWASLTAKGPYDAVFAPNGSFFVGLTAWLAASRFGAPWIYNVQDLYPDVPIRMGMVRGRGTITLLRRLERFMYDRASRITVIAPSFKTNIERKGVPSGRVVVVPNFVDTRFIRPLARINAFSTEHGLDGRFAVGYAGNLGYASELETLLKAAKAVEGLSEMRFVIVGEGISKPGLVAEAGRLGLRNILFLPFQPRERLPEMRAAMDVHLSLYKRGASSDSLPSKTYEIMASGRPIVLAADPGSDVWNLVQSAGCGICLEPGDAKGLAEALLSLEKDATMRTEMGRRGRLEADGSFSKNTAIDSYERLFQDVSGTPHQRLKTSTAMSESVR